MNNNMDTTYKQFETTKDIPMEWKGINIVVPESTRVTNMTATGPDDGYLFVDEYGWMEEDLSAWLHEARHYGIPISPTDVRLI